MSNPIEENKPLISYIYIYENLNILGFGMVPVPYLVLIGSHLLIAI
jgi:hypothetical protein